MSVDEGDSLGSAYLLNGEGGGYSRFSSKRKTDVRDVVLEAVGFKG